VLDGCEQRLAVQMTSDCAVDFDER